MSDTVQTIAQHIAGKQGDKIIDSSVAFEELTISVALKNLLSVLKFLRDDAQCHFKMFIDITAVDWPGRGDARFDVVYHLLSLKQNHRIRVKVAVDEDVMVPSVSQLFSAAGWFEREVWDMYGIPFQNHTDLRRILTDYGFEGHPLRKDFPLTGYTELRYDPESAKVVYEPVTLTQDYRDFDFESPWEAMTNVQLPGDEKANHKQSYGAHDRASSQDQE